MKHFGWEIYRDGAMLFSKYAFRRHGMLVFSIDDINWHSIVKKNFTFFPFPIKKTTVDPWALSYSVYCSPLLALLFWCSDWPRFDQCKQPLQPASCVLLIRFHRYSSTSLLSDTAKCSGLTCTFLAPALKSVFSKEPWFLSVENCI